MSNFQNKRKGINRADRTDIYIEIILIYVKNRL